MRDGLAREVNSRQAALRVVANVVLPILLGTLIYVIWRPLGLRVFQWADAVGIHAPVAALRLHGSRVRPHVPDFVLFSLPDGLWAYGFVASLCIIWPVPRPPAFRVWALLAAAAILGPEVAQGFGIVPGTFDVADLLASFFGICLALMIVGQRGPWPVRLTRKGLSNGNPF
jgi:hypothetical protein